MLVDTDRWRQVFPLRGRFREGILPDVTSQKRHKRINLTDPEARLMKGRQGIVAGYNAQAMVSATKTEEGTAGMLVTAVDVVDQANDNSLLAPMVEQAEETTGTKSQMTLADAGYFSSSQLAECDRRGQQVVVSEARQRFLKDPYHKDRFTYDERSDSFTCPQGQTVAFVRIQHANGVPLRLYRALSLLLSLFLLLSSTVPLMGVAQCDNWTCLPVVALCNNWPGCKPECR